MGKDDLERLRRAAQGQRTGTRSRPTPARGATVKLTPLNLKSSGGGGGAPSLFDQVRSTVSAVPGGLAHLGASAFDSTVGNVGALAAAITGSSADDVRKMSPIGRALVNESMLETTQRDGLSLSSLKAALPLYDELGGSLVDTSRRLEQQHAANVRLKPHEGPYGDAVREGAIVPTLVEDVGNTAMVGAFGGQAVAGGARAAAARAGRGAMAGRPVRAALTANRGLPVAGRLGQAAERGATVARKIDEGLGKALLAPMRAPMLPNAALRRITGKGMGQRIREGGRLPKLTKFADEHMLTPTTRGLRTEIADQRQWAGEQVGRITDAAQRSIEVVDVPAEAIAGMFRAGGVAESVSRLGDLPDGMRTQIAEGMLSDPVFRDALRDADPADYSTGLDLAIRSLADPDSIDPAVRSRIERSQGAWDDVAPMIEENYRDQIGVMDPRSPEVVSMLAGDDLLSFETQRVLGDYTTERARLLEQVDKVSGQRDRARGRVRLDDDMMESGGRGMADRARQINDLANKLIDVEGLPVVARRLFGDADDVKFNAAGEVVSMSEKQLRTKTRDRLVREINGRAALLDAGDTPTPDFITDAVQNADIKGTVIPSLRGFGASRAEAGKAALVDQSGRTAERLSRAVAKAERAVDRVSTAIERAMLADPSPSQGRVGKMRTAIGRELAASKDVRAAARALTKVEQRLQAGERLSDAEIMAEVSEIRRAAIPVLERVIEEFEGRLLRTWHEGPIRFGPDDAEFQTRLIDTLAQRTGYKKQVIRNWTYRPRKGAKASEGIRVFAPATQRVGGTTLDNVPAHMEGNVPGITRHSPIDDVVDVMIRDLTELIQAKDLHIWIKGGKRQAGGGIRAFLDPTNPEPGMRMLTAVLDQMDAEYGGLARASFADDAIDAVRELEAEHFNEGWAGAIEATEAGTHAARVAAELEPDGPAPDFDAVVDRIVDEEALSGVEAEGAARVADLEGARMAEDQASRQREVAEGRVTRESFRQGARAGGRAGQKLGQAEGRLSALEGERRRAERGSQRDVDVETAEFGVAAEVSERAGRQMFAEGKRSRDVEKLDRDLTQLARKLGKLDAQFPARMQAAMEKVTSAPARYRLAINAGQAATRAIDDMLRTLDPDDVTNRDLLRSVQAEMVDNAVRAVDELSRPRFIQGGRIPRGKVDPGSITPPARKTKGERLKAGAFPSLTDTNQAILMAREVFTQSRNEVVKHMVRSYGRTALDVDLPPGFVDDNGTITATGEQLADAVRAVSDEELVAWNPRSPFDRVPDEAVNAETVFVPKWSRDAFGGEYGAAGAVEGVMQSLIDTPTRLWKHSVLALSPRWHMGNMAGNMLMAWAGGVPPHRQLELAREARRMTADRTGPQRMRGSGVSNESQSMLGLGQSLGDEGRAPTRAAMREFRDPNNRVQGALLSPFDPDSRTGRAASKVAHPIRSSYDANGWIDDFTHNLVYLDRIKKGVGEAQAIKDALRVAGDFSNMTKFERQFIRRTLPFYSWMRHITGLSKHLVEDHPLRTAWTLHLWTLFADRQEDVSDIPHLAGSVQTGDNGFIRAANYMPFGTVTDFDPTDPIATIGAAANPIGKLAIEGGTGMQFGPGGLKALSRPPGTGSLDEYGSPRQGPLSLGEFGHRALQLTPQTRAAQRMLRAPEDRVVRYGTGQPVTLKGKYGRRTIPDENSSSNKDLVLRDLLGLPVPVEANPAQTRAQIAERRKRNR